MLIACKFRRPNAPVELPTKDGKTTTYLFRPIDPNAPESEHVAEVTDPDHISRLLAIPEGYHIAQSEALIRAAEDGAQVAAKPKATPSAAQVGAAAQSAVAANAGAVKVPDATAETSAAAATGQAGPPDGTPEEAAAKNEAAMALLALSPRDFKKAVGAQADRAVLETALAIESGKGADERATYTKALKAALTG